MSEAKMRDAMDVAWEKNKYEGEESFEADPFDMFRDGYYAACAHKESEFAKEREQLREANAKLDVLAEVCTDAGCENLDDLKARLADSNKLNKLEPLRREVAMLRKAVSNYFHPNNLSGTSNRLESYGALVRVLSDTQATSEAYERELKAKALEEVANFYYNAEWRETSKGVVISRSNLIKQLRDKAAQFRSC